MLFAAARTIDGGGHPGLSAKDLRQMTLAGKPGIERNGRDREHFVRQELSGALDAPRHDVLMRRESCGLLEQSHKMKGTDPNLQRQVGDRQPLRKVLLDELHQAREVRWRGRRIARMLA